MCEFVITGALQALTAGGATAAGATAGAGLQALGTAVTIGGTAISAINTARAYRASSAEVERQAEQTRQLTAVEDRRARRDFLSAIRRQSAELLARGIAPDSPTAIALGETAAREMSFDSQTVRQGGRSRVVELSSQSRALRSRATQSIFRGGASAAATVLNRAPDLWPGLLA